MGYVPGPRKKREYVRNILIEDEYSRDNTKRLWLYYIFKHTDFTQQFPETSLQHKIYDFLAQNTVPLPENLVRISKSIQEAEEELRGKKVKSKLRNKSKKMEYEKKDWVKETYG